VKSAMSKTEKAENENLKNTVQHLLEDMETLKKRIKHIEDQIIKLKSGRKWV